MKILVLGGDGMAGHLMTTYLRESGLDVWSSTRTGVGGERSIAHLIRSESDVYRVISQVKPNVVVNAIGVLNEHAQHCIADAIVANSLLPQWLGKLANQCGYRLIHISTDCVFRGTTGAYREADVTDGVGVYAWTKSLGELGAAPHLTLRTSIIGPELKSTGIGLFHWFMQQSGFVHGYACAWWNGVTTLELAKTVRRLLDQPVSGLLHLTGVRDMTKLSLLALLQAEFAREDVVLLPDETKVVNKTLRNTRADFCPEIADYPEMLEELHQWMKQHKTLYESFYPTCVV